MIAAVIFDMDGLLIDSEPFWRQAEMEVFARVGVTLTDAMCMQTTGLRIDAVVEHWYQRMPWQGTSREDVTASISGRVAELIASDAKALPGVDLALNFFKVRGFPVALCSSSPTLVIDAALRKLGLVGRLRAVVSAESEAYGKPHPAVYMTTAAKLGVKPEDCLAIEDSLNGCIAAKAARMKVIAVPEAHAERARFGFCEATLRSLADLDEPLFARLNDPSRA
jgi:sugar-phosphatase